MAAPRRSRPTSNFNPRSPHGERHAVRPPHARHDGFQPTLPARGATHVPSQLEEIIMISTHAPRTGSDLQGRLLFCQHYNFNPRSPHGERHLRAINRRRATTFQPTLPARGATVVADELLQICLFQPTLPARGATNTSGVYGAMYVDFNPRSPHGERLTLSSTLLVLFSISTHAPRTGSDPFRNPRHFRLCISTHAPRTGSDVGLYTIVVGVLDFNPRSPHGERHVS